MKMSVINLSLLVVLVLAPITTQVAEAAAPAAGEGAAAAAVAEHEGGKKPEIWLLPEIPIILQPHPFLVTVRCIYSLSRYVSEIFGFIHQHTPLSELACDVILALPASCSDALHHLLDLPFKQSQLVAAICGAASPPSL